MRKVIQSICKKPYLNFLFLISAKNKSNSLTNNQINNPFPVVADDQNQVKTIESFPPSLPKSNGQASIEASNKYSFQLHHTHKIKG